MLFSRTTALRGLAALAIASATSLTIAVPAFAASSTGPAIYTSLPADTVNTPSVGFQADSVSEFGNEITFAPGSSRYLSAISVRMNSYGCESGSWSANCVTTPGATFSEPVTVNIYAANADHTTGALLATSTKTFDIAYRPSTDATACPGTAKFLFNGTTCSNSLPVNLTWNFQGETLPDSVIWSVQYNTSDHGPQPYGESTACFTSPGGCGYDSLNVGLNVINAPSVGSDNVPGTVMANSTWGGFYCDNGTAGTGTFRIDSPTNTCWDSSTDGSGVAPFYVPAAEIDGVTLGTDLPSGGANGVLMIGAASSLMLAGFIYMGRRRKVAKAS